MGFLRYWNRLRSRGARAGRPAPRSRPYLECLEDRLVPSTYYVANGGSDAVGRGGPTTPFASIQYAVNQAAASGDRILVAGGTYTESNDAAAYANFTGIGTNAVVIVENKSVAILGGFNAANWNVPANATAYPTIIDGQGSYRGVLVLGSDSSQPPAAIDLENFYVQNGLARGNTAATGDDAIFGFGAGVFVNLGDQQNSAVTQVFNNDVFRYNNATGENTSGNYGGGGAGGGMALREVTDAVLTNVTFQNDQARGGTGSIRGGQGLGGALDLDASAISNASNVTFTDNTATGGTSAGSGITSDGQRADGIGGAIALQDSSSLVLATSTATGNVATGGTSAATAGGGFGGAIAADSSSVTVTDTTLSGNSVQGGSSPVGGLAAGGGIDMTDADLSLNRVSVVANQAIGGTSSTSSTSGANGAVTGGGIYLLHLDTTTRSATLENTVVADNTVEFNTSTGNFNNGGGGGGIWIQGDPTTILQSTIANNTLGANLYYGSAILLMADETTAGTTTADISYSIIANNNGPISGAGSNGAVQSFAGTTVTTTSNLFANNNGDTSTSGPGEETGGSISDNTSNPSIAATTAGFVSPGAPNENYNILGTSPAINQAVGSSETLDRNNLARVGTPDIGAYEYQPPPTPVIQFSAAQFDFFETSQLATVTLTRTAYLNTTSTVWIATSPGTATVNTSTVDGDYLVPNSVPITFPVGAATETFNIVLHLANHAEAPVVNFYVFLGSPSSGTVLGAQASAVVNLVNNEPSDLAKFISGAYHTLLNQPVDATDFVNLYNTLYPNFESSLTNDAVEFLTSQSYFDTQIEAAYVTFLGRAAQAADLNYWYALYGFYSSQAATQATAYERVLADIVGSSESIAHNTSKSATWLNAVYQGLLGRGVDQGGQAFFGPQLKSSQPSTYVSVTLQIMQSLEYRDKTVSNDFKTLLNRSPSAAEMSGYANELATSARYVVAAQLMSSTEYFLDAGNSISGWVNRAYSTVLGYTGDTAGAAYHQNVILNGFVNQRAAVINTILASPAYQPVLIQNTYQQILGRAATSAEVTNELSYLTNHTAEQLRASLYGSAEYLQKVGGDLGDWLDQIFLSALGRPIDLAGFNYFVGQYNAGTTTTGLANEILATGEYYSNLTNQLYQQLLGRSAVAAEQSYFSTLLTQGVSDQAVITAVLISPEAFTKEQQKAFP